ncbi:mitochondrial carrier domain-containing protein [Fimicolochytrium jonesii]|uniref:mitochondrial carrier domain-containing protein n=1 Tax=Fimicolochytrium jonesii TaxID=1396493 RepID=UPI0022FE9B4F|nr:mitochondrial carrier domain-containing protein [Fimicolochytrium jonesii]KAI8817646.1 mitochondrial carrier domain-containing protein [Fimicolochytrium jonesii]
MEEEVDYEVLPTTSVATNMLAGALAGITEHTVMYPLDSVKTRMQVLSPSPQAIYTGVANALSRISTAEGASTLWRGVTSVIVGAGPAHALYFATYEKCKEVFSSKDNIHNHLAHAGAGACATIVSDGLMNPFDVIKQRMQVHGSTYRGVVECGLDIMRKEGLAAFYISYPTTLMMTVPFQAVHFSTYEYFRKILNPKGGYDPKTHIASGAIAGAAAAAITNPLDVAKTLLQTRGAASDTKVRQASGMIDAFKLIYTRNGLAGFTMGAKARMLSHMPATAICWTTYEFLKMVLSKQPGFANEPIVTPVNPSS